SEVQVRILYDAFTRGLEIKAGFGEPKPAVIPQNSPQNVIAASTSPGASPSGSAEGAAASRTCNLVLRLEDGSRELRARLASDAEPAGIGRNSANDLIIDDSTVSNFHAALALASDGNLFLADRGSSNGTYVNGVALEAGGRCVVRNGDRLRFGDVEATLKFTI